MSRDSSAHNQPKIYAAEILEGIRRWVEIETPSHDGKAVNRLVDLVEGEMRALGTVIDRSPGRDGFGETLKARSPWGEGQAGILVLAHLDTVHPMGTLGDYPFKAEGDIARGPGIYDMKGGGYLATYAYRHLLRLGRQTPLPITFLFVPDEEIGSDTARAIIEAEAKKNKFVLVCEPARDGGKIVTARKGAARFTIKARGRPAHSGLRHQDGRSAVKEIAHQILALEAMTDYASGTTVSVGLVRGGTGVNVVPEHAAIEVDMRVADMASAEAMTARVLGLLPVGPDTTLDISGGLNRPPYRKDAGIEKLFKHAQGLAKEIGFDLQDVPLTGGGSDGNFTAALGIPTLDGLGVDGSGAHTLDEQVKISSLEPRTTLLLRLFETLS